MAEFVPSTALGAALPTIRGMSGSPRVLVVEDDRDIADVLRRSLGMEGYEVRLAGDGEEALAESSVFERDAVVLDLGLPKFDGVEVCRPCARTGTCRS